MRPRAASHVKAAPRSTSRRTTNHPPLPIAVPSTAKTNQSHSLACALACVSQCGPRTKKPLLSMVSPLLFYPPLASSSTSSIPAPTSVTVVVLLYCSKACTVTTAVAKKQAHIAIDIAHTNPLAFVPLLLYTHKFSMNFLVKPSNSHQMLDH